MKAVALTEELSLGIAILPIDTLKPHEKGSPLYLELLKQEILRDNMLRYPIIASEEGVILDGMHRWLALKSLGYTLIPVIIVDGTQRNRIRVGRRRIHRYALDSESLPIESVITAGLDGNLMEPRSTRHFFPFSKFQQVNYPLNLLKKGKPSDVSKYLSRMTPAECNISIKEWLGEIDEELEFLVSRKEEVERERREFIIRMKSLNGLLAFQ